MVSFSKIQVGSFMVSNFDTEPGSRCDSSEVLYIFLEGLKSHLVNYCVPSSNYH